MEQILRGTKFLCQKIRGLKFLCRKIRGLKFFGTKIRGAKILVDLQKYTPTGCVVCTSFVKKMSVENDLKVYSSLILNKESIFRYYETRTISQIAEI